MYAMIDINNSYSELVEIYTFATVHSLIQVKPLCRPPYIYVSADDGLASKGLHASLAGHAAGFLLCVLNFLEAFCKKQTLSVDDEVLRINNKALMNGNIFLTIDTIMEVFTLTLELFITMFKTFEY